MKKKIGMIGYLCNTGLGCQIQDYKKNLPIDSHYVIPHPNIGIDEDKLDDRCVVGIPVDDWLKSIDVLVTIESAFIDDVFTKAKSFGVRVVLVVNADWFSPDLENWWKNVDVFICPNLYTKKKVMSLGYKNLVYIPASVDTEYFEFRPRRKVETFLFNNGWGGVRARKGLNEVVTVFMGNDLPLVLNSQSHIDVRLPKVKLVIKNYSEQIEIYRYGDLYLAPSKWEGHGIHILEAMACGLPVLTTGSPPMNEYVDKDDYCIRVKKVQKVKSWRMDTVESVINIDDFRDRVIRFYGRNVERDSLYFRERVEKYYSYRANKDMFVKVFRGDL